MYFDPFRRRKKFKYFFDKDKKIILYTTIGQLNFFRWAFTNDVISYVLNNYISISKAMVNTNKMDKSRKLKEKQDKESKIQKDNRNNKNELNIKKNGINIKATKKIKHNEVKIILSFD